MRLERDDGPGAVHHLTCRVNWQAFHLSDPGHAAVYREEVATALDEFDVAQLGGALMSNHHHLTLRMPGEARYRVLTTWRTRCRHRKRYPPGHLRHTVIAQFAHRVHRRIARRIHRRLDVTGHFWDRRYFARRIKDAADLVKVIAYEHRNPVRPGIVRRPEDYPWSSASAYATGDRAASLLPLATDEALPFGLTWDRLRQRVLEYQASDAIDEIHRELESRGLAAGSVPYGIALTELLQAHGLPA